MIHSKRTFFLGIFIFLIPYLGVPSSWKTALIVLSGILLVLLSIRVSLPKQSSRRPRKKEKVTPIFVESAPTERAQESRENQSVNENL